MVEQKHTMKWRWKIHIHACNLFSVRIFTLNERKNSQKLIRIKKLELKRTINTIKTTTNIIELYTCKL